MNRQKLCFEHGNNLKKSRWVLVNPDKCFLCLLANDLQNILNEEFGELRP